MPRHHLLLMRHADAEPGRPGTADVQRQLTARGHDRAASQASVVAAHPPDAVLCSAATRAVQTLSHLPVDAAGAHVEMRLYEAGPTEVLLRLAEVGESHGTVLVIGHMPTVAAVALALLPDLADTVEDGVAGASTLHRRRGFAPGDIAVLDLDSAWADIASGTATLRQFAT